MNTNTTNTTNSTLSNDMETNIENANTDRHQIPIPVDYNVDVDGDADADARLPRLKGKVKNGVNAIQKIHTFVRNKRNKNRDRNKQQRNRNRNRDRDRNRQQTETNHNSNHNENDNGSENENELRLPSNINITIASTSSSSWNDNNNEEMAMSMSMPMAIQTDANDDENDYGHEKEHEQRHEYEENNNSSSSLSTSLNATNTNTNTSSTSMLTLTTHTITDPITDPITDTETNKDTNTRSDVTVQRTNTKRKTITIPKSCSLPSQNQNQNQNQSEFDVGQSFHQWTQDIHNLIASHEFQQVIESTGQIAAKTKDVAIHTVCHTVRHAVATTVHHTIFLPMTVIATVATVATIPVSITSGVVSNIMGGCGFGFGSTNGYEHANGNGNGQVHENDSVQLICERQRSNNENNNNNNNDDDDVSNGSNGDGNGDRNGDCCNHDNPIIQHQDDHQHDVFDAVTGFIPFAINVALKVQSEVGSNLIHFVSGGGDKSEDNVDRKNVDYDNVNNNTDDGTSGNNSNKNGISTRVWTRTGVHSIVDDDNHNNNNSSSIGPNVPVKYNKYTKDNVNDNSVMDMGKSKPTIDSFTIRVCDLNIYTCTSDTKSDTCTDDIDTDMNETMKVPLQLPLVQLELKRENDWYSEHIQSTVDSMVEIALALANDSIGPLRSKLAEQQKQKEKQEQKQTFHPISPPPIDANMNMDVDGNVNGNGNANVSPLATSSLTLPVQVKNLQRNNSGRSNSVKASARASTRNILYQDIRWKEEGSTAKLRKGIMTRKRDRGSDKNGCTNTDLDMNECICTPKVLENLERELLIWSGSVRSKAYGNKIPMMKGRGIVAGISPSKLVETFMDSSKVQEYNKFSNGRKDVQILYTSKVKAVENNSCSNVNDKVPAHAPALLTGVTKIVENETKIPLSGKIMCMSTLLHARSLNVDSEDEYIIVSRSTSTKMKHQGYDQNEVNVNIGIDQVEASPGAKNEIIWGVNVLRKVPGHPNKVDLTTLTQANSSAVPAFLAHKIGMMCINDFFKNVRKLGQ